MANPNDGDASPNDTKNNKSKTLMSNGNDFSKIEKEATMETTSSLSSNNNKAFVENEKNISVKSVELLQDLTRKTGAGAPVAATEPASISTSTVTSASVNKSKPATNDTKETTHSIDLVSKRGEQTCHKCKICLKDFKTNEECLKHELLTHTNDRVPTTQRCLRNKLRNIISDRPQDLREKFRRALRFCPSNDDLLDVVCNFFRVSEEQMNFIFTRVYNSLLQDLRGSVSLYSFGSTKMGLALRDFDIDLYVEYKPGSTLFPVNYDAPSKQQLYNKIQNVLRKSDNFDEVVCIRGARVPIIKCKHRQTGFKVDLNCTERDSSANSLFYRSLFELDTRIYQLFLFLKIWAKQMQIIGVGNMASYCFLNFVLYFLQQKCLMLSIEDLATNMRPYLISGVNYAYNLNFVKPWPKNLKTETLIKDFFKFYNGFSFESKILSPYYGRELKIEELLASTEYNKQKEYALRCMTRRDYCFKHERPIAMQDPFKLSRNVAGSLTRVHSNYFQQCITYAANACCNENISTMAELYDELLFGGVAAILEFPKESSGDTAYPFPRAATPNAKPTSIAASKSAMAGTAATPVPKEAKSVGVVAKAATPAPKEAKMVATPAAKPIVQEAAIVAPILPGTSNALTATSSPSSTPTRVKKTCAANFTFQAQPPQYPAKTLTHALMPTRADIRALTNYATMNGLGPEHNIFYFWKEIYIECIENYIKEICKIDMQLTSPKHLDKHQKLDENVYVNNVSWELSASIDLWSGRNYQRVNNATYDELQRRQTEIFLNERRQNSNYAVDLKALLIIEMTPDFKNINLEIQSNDMQRNGPVSKFFSGLKCALQSFKLKERLDNSNVTTKVFGASVNKQQEQEQ